MAKNWWFKFDFKTWQTDTKLKMCSFETRGFWIQALCVMHESETYKIEGTYEELGWLLGCSPEIVARCVTELHRHVTADVTLGNGSVTLVSRRLKRELSAREHTRLRVQRHRGNADVTAQSKSKSNKKEKEEEESPEANASALHEGVWDSFRRLLIERGESEKSARSKIGRLIKTHKKPKIIAAWNAEHIRVEESQEPFAYFSKLLKTFVFETDQERKLKAAKWEHNAKYGHLEYEVPFRPERYGLDQ